MRSFFWTALLCLPLLTGCGNGNDGRKFNPFPKKSSAVNANSGVSVDTSAVTSLQQCHSPWLPSDDAALNAAFQGAVLCPGNGGNGQRSAIVRLKVNSAVTANSRVCLVPFVGDAEARETCFSINGQADVVLTTDQYSSLVLLPEGNLAAYQAYVANGGIAPGRVIFSL